MYIKIKHYYLADVISVLASSVVDHGFDNWSVMDLITGWSWI
jgi:hypothetical protein